MYSSETPPSGKRILIVGLCCLDICNYVKCYPAEDTDNRVFEQRFCLGGNASNNMSILKQLNSHSELFTVLPENDPIIERELLKNPINVSKSIRRPQFDIPITNIMISEENGSRTIFHYRGNLVEPKFEEFVEKVPRPEEYSWIHFEGRNTEEVKKMLEYVYEYRKKTSNHRRPRISIELEKIRPEPWLEQLIPYADVIFMSKDYARSKGWTSKTDAVLKMFYEFSSHQPLVICPWADEIGCAFIDSIIGEPITVPGHHPDKVVDTLAAGDCFIGSAIHFLNHDLSTKEALEYANKIAGIKVGQKGLLNLPLDFLKN